MRTKSQQSKRFLQTCYYKFGVSKSLRYITANPLLVPNMRGGNTLCPASNKKKVHSHKNSESHYNKTFYQKWACLNNNISQIKKTNGNQDIQIFPAPTHHIIKGSKNLQARAQQIKKQRKQIFKRQYDNTKQLKKSGRSYAEDKRIKTYSREPQNEGLKRSRKLLTKPESNNQVKSIQKNRNHLPTFPNKWEHRSQIIKNDGLEGWEFIQNEQDLRLSHFGRT